MTSLPVFFQVHKRSLSAFFFSNSSSFLYKKKRKKKKQNPKLSGKKKFWVQIKEKIVLVSDSVCQFTSLALKQLISNTRVFFSLENYWFQKSLGYIGMGALAKITQTYNLSVLGATCKGTWWLKLEHIT